MRAYIYARYSTDRQRETSIEDQLRVCRARIEASGWELQGMQRDEEVSGSTPVGRRPGGAQLLADAMAGRFDVLVLEGLDRLSRDLVEQETVVRRLEHRGIRIIGVADGYDSESAGRKLHRGMRGLINEIYLDDLRHKTHRGQAGQVARGYSAGGGAYGYRSVHDGRGWRLEIDEDQAQWVRWIFREYVAGRSPRGCAHELNRLGVPAPRGGTWVVSAIYGSRVKGCGILNNPLYRGDYIWNRSQWVKDPDTGRRKRIERPEHEWIREHRPELRIVPEELWQAAHERYNRASHRGGSCGKGGVPRTLLGGLMTCGYCGGLVVAVSGRHYGCSARQDRGASVCRGVLVRRDEAELRLLGCLRDELLAPEAIAQVEREVARILDEQSNQQAQANRVAKARLAELDGEIGRLVDAIARVGISPSLQERLRAAEAERIQLRQQLGAQSTAPRGQSVLKPGEVARRYREMVMNLQEALREDIPRAREALQRVLGPVVLVEEGENLYAQMETNPQLLLAAGGLSMGLVAGARFVTKRRILLR